MSSNGNPQPDPVNGRAPNGAPCPASGGKTAKHYHLLDIKEIEGIAQTKSMFGVANRPALDDLGKAFVDDRKPTYDRATADMLADVAAWSYSNGQALIEALAERGIVRSNVCCHEVSVSNGPMFVIATAFLIRAGNVAVLSFRGTEPDNALNFLTDVSVQTKNFLSLGRVHGGFHRNVRAVWSEIATCLHKAVNDPDETKRLKALYITGHSLGGAMAVIAAAIIHGDREHLELQKRLRGVYTYGQPMVGDATFAESCKDRFGHLLHRHVYGRDVVPRLPPLSTGHFVHFGNEYAGNDEGWEPRAKALVQTRAVLVSVPLGALAFVFKQLPLLSRVQLPFSLLDHSPVSYLEAFRAARP